MNNEIIDEKVTEDTLTTSAVFDPKHLQLASQDIWRSKYQLKTSSGTPVDHSVIDTFERVAKAIANVETTQRNNRNTVKNFYGH
ncbi:hypothetical protein L3081_00465 [Colwellia sp. MSW7]|uniref:Uncharacterized protein n=1 Tax=Colwellia maritima TaxID=2912588 RepID=A0ABS9WW38_9GAMM|nr:hypothetical protein [Colwellia maritima]MCI2282148.1 hypothetical protein [Colwellia maritima]